ncbi:MAG: hypothetical protein H6506_03815 [Calditrichaeota bacterium]|nr:hypothetical protein [Calditrichota bacterium]MCB9391760.1 hypothetical protein [Calditrichota bacterium]
MSPFLSAHILLLSALIALPAIKSLALEYSVTFLGSLPGQLTTRALAVNDLGHVCGFSGTKAFYWSPESGMVELPPLAGRTDAIANDLNNFDVVAGTSGIDFNGPQANHAVRWNNGVVEDLGLLPSGTRSQGFGINDSGWVAGYGHYLLSGSEYWRPSLYRDGFGMTVLNGLTGGFAYDISNNGKVVGFSSGGAYTWTVADSFTYLGAPAGWGSTRASGISLDGEWVAGSVLSASGNLIQFARWSAATGWEWFAGVNNSGMVSINSHGDCVGSGSGLTGYLYMDSLGLQDVNAYIDPLSGWVINTVSDINESGQIAASGQNTITFEAGAILLTPITTTLPAVDDLNVAFFDDSLHFTWTAVAGASLYHLYFSESLPVPATPEAEVAQTAGVSLTLPLQPPAIGFFAVTYE